MSAIRPRTDSNVIVEETIGAVGGEADPTGQRSSVSMTMQDLLPLFECPVCYDFILPPISQCTQGHLICSSCKEKVNRCPTCREELGSIRCLFMEKVADSLLFPCKYSVNGCDTLLNQTNKMSHEQDECAFKLFFCPYRFIDTCLEFIGPSEGLVMHLLNNHSDNFKKEHCHSLPHNQPEASFVPIVNVVDYKVENNSTSWMWTFIQTCFEKTFVINLYYVHNGSWNLHFVTARMVGTKQEAKKFNYQITLHGPSGNLTYSGSCHSMHKMVKEIYDHRDCLHFDRMTALRCLTKVPASDGQRKKVLKFSIKLSTAEES